jgi:mono/diheme cytochrome c family protein
MTLSLLAACRSEDDVQSTNAPTYFEDVKPIFDGYCVDCHAADGGISFPLTTYESTAAIAALIAEEVAEKRMPPWGAEPGHTPLKFDVSLSEEQIDLVVDWAIDAVEGDSKNEGDAIEVDRGGLERIDLELPMAVEYAPTGYPDDYRCFALEWPEDEPTYITGFVGLPGNQEVVHHLVTFLVQPDQADLVNGFDAMYDDGPGWPCFGGPTPSENYDGDGVFGQMLGVWAPGMGGMTLPEGTGVPISPGSVPVLQVHYSTLNSNESDLSALGIQLSDEPGKTGFVLPFFDLSWYMAPSSMGIPAGEADVQHGYETAIKDDYILQMVGFDVTGAEIHSVFPHMHRLGTAISVYLDRANGDREYLVNVPSYDFDWQREYVFEASLIAGPDDTLGIECHWNNTESYRIENDVMPREPEDVGWGERTVDEMCIATMYMTTP